eukprot:291754-Pelagomonas_calceolata.AAC.1
MATDCAATKSAAHRCMSLVSANVLSPRCEPSHSAATKCVSRHGMNQAATNCAATDCATHHGMIQGQH